jgi:hypothetical protein
MILQQFQENFIYIYWNFSRGIFSALLDILWETIKVNPKEKKNETQFVDEITKNLVTTYPRKNIRVLFRQFT